jgi:hypothetical protein
MVVVCCLFEDDSKTARQLFGCQEPIWENNAIQQPIIFALFSAIQRAAKRLSFVSVAAIESDNKKLLLRDHAPGL